MANIQIDLIEVVDREHGNVLTRAYAPFAQQLYEASGLLRMLEITEEDGLNVISLPIEPGTFSGPGNFANQTYPNENVEQGRIKEQLLLDIIGEQPIYIEDCYGDVNLIPPYSMSNVIQVFQYLLVDDPNIRQSLVRVRVLTDAERREVAIQDILTELVAEAYHYADLVAMYNEHNNNAGSNPLTWQPVVSLEEIRSIVLGQIISDCERFRYWLSLQTRSQTNWVQDLLLHMLSTGHFGDGSNEYEVEAAIRVNGRDFLNQLIDGHLEGGRRRRRSTRRQKKRRGTQKSKRRS